VFDLEDELGLKLFSRTHRNARLTPEGEIFYADAVRILQQAETAILTATLSFLPDLIRRYKLEYPNVKLELHDLYPVELDKACDRGEIDIAITRTLSLERSVAEPINPIESLPTSPWAARLRAEFRKFPVFFPVSREFGGRKVSARLRAPPVHS
jgi:DNA-binding transcriptional LysR family regulator